MDSGQSGQHDGDPDPCPANDGLIMLCTRCASGRARSNGHHFTSVVAYLCLCLSLSPSPSPSRSLPLFLAVGVSVPRLLQSLSRSALSETRPVVPASAAH